jgi:ubiquinone biosynthesis protein UbiJ
VTELVTGAPPGVHAALTLVVDEAGARLRPGDDGAASAWITVSMADAESLHDGALDPAVALTEGRVRVRGDLRAVVDAVGLLADAHQRLRGRDATGGGPSDAAPGRT